MAPKTKTPTDAATAAPTTPAELAPADTTPTSSDPATAAEDETGAVDAAIVLAVPGGGGLIRGVQASDMLELYNGFERAPMHVKLAEGDVVTGRFVRFGRTPGKDTIDPLTGEVAPKVYDTVVIDCGGSVGPIQFLSAHELHRQLIDTPPGTVVRITRGRTEQAGARVVTRYVVGFLRRPLPGEAAGR